jgi:iron(III) transport system substrate-binding protein
MIQSLSATGARPRRNVLIAASLGVAAAIALAACGGGSGEGTGGEEPETKGIYLYSGRIGPLIGPAIDDYEAEVDRDVEVKFGDSGALAATLLEEGENSPADAFFSQDAGSLGAVTDAGLLAELPQDILEEVPARFRSPEGTWVGISARSRIIAYGPGVDESELPDSPLELTEPTGAGTSAQTRCASRADLHAARNVSARASATSATTSSRWAGLRDASRSPLPDTR